MRWLLGLWIAIAAGPAWAGWRTCPGQTSDAGTKAADIPQGGQVCLRQATATDPARVNALKCRGGGVDVIFASDIAGTNYDATLHVYQCPSGATDGSDAGSFTDCEKVLPVGVDQALTGNPVGNLDAIYGISPGWIAFDVTNANSRTLEVRVVCR